MIKWRFLAVYCTLVGQLCYQTDLLASSKRSSTTGRAASANTSNNSSDKVIDTTLEMELQPLPPPSPAGDPNGSYAPSNDGLLVPPQQIQQRTQTELPATTEADAFQSVAPLPPPKAWYEHWWLWASIGGVLLVGGGLTTYFLTRPNPPPYDRKWRPGGPIEPAALHVEF